VHATIFYDRIERIAQTVPPSVEQILGNAMAHEIGHVLLGSPEHSGNGIMKGVWSHADYRHLTSRPLEFLPDEAARIREAVSSRAATSMAGSRN
jgi:hypothetical protein